MLLLHLRNTCAAQLRVDYSGSRTPNVTAAALPGPHNSACHALHRSPEFGKPGILALVLPWNGFMRLF